MPRGSTKRQAGRSQGAQGAPANNSSSWTQLVSEVQQLVESPDSALLANGRQIGSVCRGILLLSGSCRCCSCLGQLGGGPSNVPCSAAGEVKQDKQLAASLSKLKLPYLLSKLLAAQYSSGSGPSKWHEDGYIQLIGSVLTTARALYSRVGGRGTGVHKDVTAAAKDVAQLQLLRGQSGMLEQLAAAQEQIAAVLQQELQPQPAQQQKVSGELIQELLRLSCCCGSLVGSHCSLNKAAVAEQGVVAVAAARLCIAVLKHPDRVCWERGDAGLCMFVNDAIVVMTDAVGCVHAAGGLVATLPDGCAWR